MLALTLLTTALLSANASCEARCATTADRCYTNCKSGSKCTQHCDSLVSDCNNRCSAENAKAEAKSRPASPSMPCGTKKGKEGRTEKVPCSEADQKAFRDAISSSEAQKAFKCRDSKGVPTPCKEDLEKAETLVKNVGPDGVCTGPDGKPALCPEAQQRVEKSFQR